MDSTMPYQFIIEKDERFTFRQPDQKTSLWLSFVHFILKKILKVREINAGRIFYHSFTEQQTTMS